MGLYHDHILPRCIHCAMGLKQFSIVRKETLQVCQGRILEIGFGSGLNLGWYPASVTQLYALDPATVGRKLAAEAIDKVPFPVDFTELSDAGAYDMDDASVDQVVSTWTMCTIPDLPGALREIKRVLKPGGSLVFAEHGLSPDESVAGWQNRLNGLQGALFGGCNLNRKIDRIVESAGFKIANLENFSMRGPKFLGYMYRGLALPKT